MSDIDILRLLRENNSLTFTPVFYKSSIKDNQNYGNINIILNNLCTDSKFNTKTFLDKFQEVKATFKHTKSIKPLENSLCFYCKTALGPFNKWTKTIHKQNGNYVAKCYHIECLNRDEISLNL